MTFDFVIRHSEDGFTYEEKQRDFHDRAGIRECNLEWFREAFLVADNTQECGHKTGSKKEFKACMIKFIEKDVNELKEELLDDAKDSIKFHWFKDG